MNAHSRALTLLLVSACVLPSKDPNEGLASFAFETGVVIDEHPVEGQPEDSALIDPICAHRSLEGWVQTPDGEPVIQATVSWLDSAGDAEEATTDGHGHYLFDRLACGDTGVLVATADGFTSDTEQVELSLADDDAKTFASFTVAEMSWEEISSLYGGTIVASDVQVALPPSAVAGPTGAPSTGTVRVEARALLPDLPGALPGPTMGVESPGDTEPRPIALVAAADIKLRLGPDDHRVDGQLVDGELADIWLPVPDDFDPPVEKTPLLFSYDEAGRRWLLEGEADWDDASRTYHAQVGHFTVWSVGWFDESESGTICATLTIPSYTETGCTNNDIESACFSTEIGTECNKTLVVEIATKSPEEEVSQITTAMTLASCPSDWGGDGEDITISDVPSDSVVISLNLSYGSFKWNAVSAEDIDASALDCSSDTRTEMAWEYADCDGDGYASHCVGGPDDDDSKVGVVEENERDDDGDGVCECNFNAEDDCAAPNCDLIDSDATIYPGAPELCDGIDNDLDGIVDDVDNDLDGDGDEDDAVWWFHDADGDGFGETYATGDDAERGYADENEPVLQACAPSDDWTTIPGDCDDSNSEINPSKTDSGQRCDDFTSGDTDDGEADPASDCLEKAIPYCVSPGSWTCGDDFTYGVDPASVYEGATEICNGVDDNCDGGVDVVIKEDGLDINVCNTYYYDADQDGYVDCATSAESDLDPPKGENQWLNATGSDTTCKNCDYCAEDPLFNRDCNDANPKRNPGANEICDDGDADEPAGVDEDCDGNADDADTDIDPAVLPYWCVDRDGDDAVVEPDFVVQRCDFNEDTGDAGTSSADEDAILLGFDDSAEAREAIEAGDLFSASTSCVSYGSDCDDDDKLISPYAVEVCGDSGVDEDCDGDVDDADSSVSGQSYWCSDGDGDTYVGDWVESCNTPGSAYKSCDEDRTQAKCQDQDDSDATLGSWYEEECDDDELDEDCDGEANDKAFLKLNTSTVGVHLLIALRPACYAYRTYPSTLWRCWYPAFFFCKLPRFLELQDSYLQDLLGSTAISSADFYELVEGSDGSLSYIYEEVTYSDEDLALFEAAISGAGHFVEVEGMTEFEAVESYEMGAETATTFATATRTTMVGSYSSYSSAILTSDVYDSWHTYSARASEFASAPSP